MPRALIQADSRERQGDLVRGPDVARDPGREAVDDGRRVRAGVPDGLGLLQQVVLPPRLPISPPERAEAVEVDEASERDQLDKRPCRTGAGILAREAAAVPVVLEAPYLADADVQALLRETRKVVPDDRVTVLLGALGQAAHQLDLREVLDVQRHRQQRVAQHVVDGREVAQVPEVEPHVLAVSLAADALVLMCNKNCAE